MTYYELTTDGILPLRESINFIETGLTAHAGWAFVEQITFTQSAVAKTCRVWKCLGSQNDGGYDFYLYLVRYTTDTLNSSAVFSVRLSEGYNASTDSMIRPAPPASSGAGVPSATDWSIGNGTEYALSLVGGAVGSQMDASVHILNSGATPVVHDHFLVVSKSFVAYGMNRAGSPIGGFYVGNFEPAYSPTYNPVAMLVPGSFSLGATYSGSATRFPNYTSLSVSNEAVPFPSTFPNGWITTIANAEPFLARTEAASVLVTAASPQLSAPALAASGRGGVRGAFPTSVMLQVSEAVTPRNGDFFNISSVEYMRIGNANAVAYSRFSQGDASFWVAKNSTY